MAGRPRQRDIETTVKKAKELFAQGLTQIEVSNKLEFSSLAAFRKHLWYYGKSIKEVME